MNLRKAAELALSRGYCVTEDGKVFNPRGMELSLNFNKDGYLRFTLRLSNRKSVSCYVHKMVAFSKFGEQSFDPTLVVRHLDGNPKNNSFDNIAIGTPGENNMDKPPELRRRVALQASAKLRRFSEADVTKMREQHAAGVSYRVLARDWNTCKSTLSYMLSKVAKKQAAY